MIAMEYETPAVMIWWASELASFIAGLALLAWPGFLIAYCKVDILSFLANWWVCAFIIVMESQGERWVCQRDARPTPLVEFQGQDATATWQQISQAMTDTNCKQTKAKEN